MNDPKPAQNRTESDERPESGLPAVQGAREARYAEAMRRSPNGPWMTLPGPTDIAPSLVRAVLPLVDAEVAAAVSEAQAEADLVESDLREVEADARNLRAEVERLRQGIRTLADEWGSGVVARLTADHAAAELRALLAHPPAATTGEAHCRCGHTKAEHPAPDGDTYCLRCSCAHYLPAVADMMRNADAVGRLLTAVDTEPPADRSWVSTEWVEEGPRPAPVSSGEAATVDCPHAAPFRYCDGCKVDPCPIGLGGR